MVKKTLFSKKLTMEINRANFTASQWYFIENRLFGSRAFITNSHLDNSKADFDFFFSMEEASKLGLDLFTIKENAAKKETLKAYFNSYPKYGDMYLLHKIPFRLINTFSSVTDINTTADILIFTHKKDVEIMAKSIKQIKMNFMSVFMSDKDIRTAIWNKVLQANGFKQMKDSNLQNNEVLLNTIDSIVENIINPKDA